MKHFVLLCMAWFLLGIVCYAQTTQDNAYYPMPEKETKPAGKKEYLSKFHTIKLGIKSGISRGSVLMSPSVNSISFAPQTGLKQLFPLNKAQRNANRLGLAAKFGFTGCSA